MIASEQSRNHGQTSSRRRGRTISRVVSLGLLAILHLGCTRPAAPPEGLVERGSAPHEVRREDIGHLIVLHLAGSYEEMGRQQVELLGDIAPDTELLFRQNWNRTLARAGWSARIANRLLIPYWSLAGTASDTSSFFGELAGIAGGLHISDSNAFRLMLGGLYGGSTSFAATREATRDGSAWLGRNIDWSDDAGRRRAVLVHYRPSNGDLPFLSVTWPLSSIPIAGMNAAGLAYSVNFFDAAEKFPVGVPSFPYRRILQRATSVEEAVAIFMDAGSLAGPGFVVLADAQGRIARLDCMPSGCSEVDIAQQPWLAAANHSRAPEVLGSDRDRSPDSFAREQAMSSAVSAKLGEIDLNAAAAILRDQGGSRYVNASTVANPMVLSTVIMHPATATLWHSTLAQPLAPFGELVAFSFGDPQVSSPPVPGALDLPARHADADAIRGLRKALILLADRDAEGALAQLDVLAGSSRLDPDRLRWVRGLALYELGRAEAARQTLAGIDAANAPFSIVGAALALRAHIARKGQDERTAVLLSAAARRHLESEPRFATSRDVATLDALLARSESGQALSFHDFPTWQKVD